MSTLGMPRERVFADENIRLGTSVGRGLSGGLLVIGLAGVVTTVIAGLVLGVGAARVVLHALHTGFVISIGLSLGGLVWTMILQAMNAGWAIVARRQFENLMSLMWVGLVMLVGIVILQAVYVNTLWDPASEEAQYGPFLWRWMNPVYVDGDVLYDHKLPFLNVPFFIIRQVLYAAVWLALAGVMWGLSRGQDEDGDRWRSAKAGRVACVGLLLYAFTTAFASFDWVMGLDFHWFSTMFGVYYFAGNALAAVAICILTLLILRGTGKLAGAFTEEHLHDLGKLLFAFTVFWAYISFSQYFLIWYANIPEEAQFFAARREPGTIWHPLSIAIPLGHFIIPFLVLLPRPARRSGVVIGAVCVWLLVFHVIDLFWMIRPEAGADGLSWIDPIAIGGMLAIFVGLFIRKVGDGPLIPLRDPRERDLLGHKNYV
ncbi:MAG: hypothetical protein AAGI30_12655 [Planctomycetota bacterium]